MTPQTLGLGMGAVQGVGNIAAGFGGNAAAKYNARVAGMQADQAREVGAEEGDSILRQGKTLVGKQRAAAASDGVDVNRGSPLRAVLDTILTSHQEAQAATLRGETKAWGLEAEATNQKWMGKQTLLGGFAKGLSSVGFGAGRIALARRLENDPYYGYNQ